MQRITRALASPFASACGRRRRADGDRSTAGSTRKLVWTADDRGDATRERVSTLAAPPTGETFSNIVKMDSSNSRMGFRGDEPLGDGVKAFFQIEQRIIVDTGDTQLASRNTFIGPGKRRGGRG